MLAAPGALAGPLLSATLEHSFRVRAIGRSVSVRVDAVAPIGTLISNTFSLAAGSACQTQRVIRPSDPTPFGAPPPLTALVISAVVALGRNGAISGTRGGDRVSPRPA